MLASMQKLLAANRGEIAIRILRAANELGLRTATVHSNEDRFSLHRFKADEAYAIGQGLGPVAAYLDVDGIVGVAKEHGCDAVHPGYGFLSESGRFARACEEAGLTFVGPPPELLDSLGDKLAARRLAAEAGVPVVPGLETRIENLDEALRGARTVGFPVIIKAVAGGGGRGMRVAWDEPEFGARVAEAREEARLTFGRADVYIERYVGNARHIEVQILADTHGDIVHLAERDCSVQRRHQKVVEVAPAPNLPSSLRQALRDAAVRIARVARYVNAGTVEFLVDADSSEFFFLEVNPRIQVEHTVTEMVTGVDLVRSQILIAQGHRLHEPPLSVPQGAELEPNGFAVQCRITTEDPEDDFAPDYGRITTYRSPAGAGIRLDGATAYAGAVLSPFYDSLLCKLTAWDRTLANACRRSDRALREFRIRGVKSNIPFLINVINDPCFQAGETTTRWVDDTPALYEFTASRDRATRLLGYVADVVVNGSPAVGVPPAAEQLEPAEPIPIDRTAPRPDGSRQLLLSVGPEALARWARAQPQLLVTDTTMRDAHQSLLATRLRTYDMLPYAEAVARRLPELFSVEMWGGATFDAALRFLHEDPWQRLRRLREALPNVCFQMLLRGSNAVGYSAYPDNVVQEFIRESHRQGIDIFRIFDSLNSIENMRVAIDAALESGAICEPAICYTGDVLDPSRPKYGISYYVQMAKELENMGAHILGIKDMAGLCRPYAAFELVQALREAVDLPIHLHTHDTSGLNAASLLKAAEAGVDIVDAAVGSLSGGTSQPNLNSVAEALRHTERDTGLDRGALSDVSRYWTSVRRYYAPFDNVPQSGSADVYEHEIPGGQFSNLQQQATALGLGGRWREVEAMYAEVNRLFGDIVKVTPSSKVVGDMALFLLARGMKAAEVLQLPPDHDVQFPDSVRDMLAGGLGTPPDGWPEDLQRIVLKDTSFREGRPGGDLSNVDFGRVRAQLGSKGEEDGMDQALSAVLYPDVYDKFRDIRRQYGDVSVLPTPTFFYGGGAGVEVAADIEEGKTLIFRHQTIGEAQPDGTRTVFFELNGQPREVTVRDRSLAVHESTRVKAEAGQVGQIGAPWPGIVTGIYVETSRPVAQDERLLTIEAMKLQITVYAPFDGTITAIAVEPGDEVEAKDLLVTIETS